MEGAKRVPLSARKKPMRKNRRLVRSIVSYLKSDSYLYAPLFPNFPPQMQTPPPPYSESSKAEDLPVAVSEAMRIEKVKKNKRRMSEKVKEYLKSYCHMYTPIISPPKLGSSLKGKLQITNLVTMEVSTSTTTTREDNNNYNNLKSDIVDNTLHNGRIDSPKRSLVILEGQRTGVSRETDFSPPFSSQPEEKLVKPNPRRVPIE